MKFTEGEIFGECIATGLVAFKKTNKGTVLSEMAVGKALSRKRSDQRWRCESAYARGRMERSMAAA